MATLYRRLPRFEYLRAGSIEEALSLLTKHGSEGKVFAGGTDLLPQLRRREIPVPRYLIDLKGIDELFSVDFDERHGLRIGSLATIRTLAESPFTLSGFPALAQAALKMGSPQVRNRGTLAGNICSAVPSADSAPALLVGDARLVIRGPKGERTVPIDRFFTGVRQTVLERDELLLQIALPAPPPGTRSTYLKLSPRHSMDLAVVGVAASAYCIDGVCKDIKIGLCAVAPTPIRALESEAMLEGRPASTALIEEAARKAATECSPIDDHRASKEYRCDMVYAMTRRALFEILERRM